MWFLNAMSLIACAFNFLILTIGAYYFRFLIIGTLCNCCCSIFHGFVIYNLYLGMISPFGKLCKLNTSTSTYIGDYQWDYSGTTYYDEHTSILFMGIIQACLFTCQCFCCWIPCYTTPLNHDIEIEAEKVE